MATPPVRPAPEAGEDAALVEVLKTLASESRLDLLRQLRLPRATSDLTGRPVRSVGALNPARPMSTEGVRQHLARLRDAGLVRDAPGQGPQRHVIDRTRMYALAQTMLRLATLTHPADWGDPDATVPAASGAHGARKAATGPRLVLVMGVYEGREYALSPATSRERAGQGPAWTIGRSIDLPVSLDYDPYVSREHAWVTQRGEDFLLHDAPRSQNGTSLNWTPIPEGKPHPLQPGDVIGVGRSLLVFRAA